MCAAIMTSVRFKNQTQDQNICCLVYERSIDTQSKVTKSLGFTYAASGFNTKISSVKFYSQEENQKVNYRFNKSEMEKWR